VYAAGGRFLGLGRNEAGLLAPLRLVVPGIEK
jgi:hypothetical protein